MSIFSRVPLLTYLVWKLWTLDSQSQARVTLGVNLQGRYPMKKMRFMVLLLAFIFLCEMSTPTVEAQYVPPPPPGGWVLAAPPAVQCPPNYEVLNAACPLISSLSCTTNVNRLCANNLPPPGGAVEVQVGNANFAWQASGKDLQV